MVACYQVSHLPGGTSTWYQVPSQHPSNFHPSSATRSSIATFLYVRNCDSVVVVWYDHRHPGTGTPGTRSLPPSSIPVSVLSSSRLSCSGVLCLTWELVPGSVYKRLEFWWEEFGSNKTEIRFYFCSVWKWNISTDYSIAGVVSDRADYPFMPVSAIDATAAVDRETASSDGVRRRFK